MADEMAEEKEKPSGVLKLLELGDGIAHFAVSILLLLLALLILCTSTSGFVDAVAKTPYSNAIVRNGLEYLSDLLFGVIILELLSTLLTYIKARKLEATIKDFMVVAIISSIRKILLVGAQSSTEKTTGDAFIKESLGTLITIVGIILLIGGFIFLDRHRRRVAPESTAE